MPKFSFEKAMERLEQIVDNLESGELGLEESIKVFEEGVQLSKTCYKKLSEAQLKVKKLIKGDGDEFDLGLFEGEEE